MEEAPENCHILHMPIERMNALKRVILQAILTQQITQSQRLLLNSFQNLNDFFKPEKLYSSVSGLAVPSCTDICLISVQY
jgi:hypothetical protein